MFYMTGRELGKTYIREWREYRGLSLRRLAGRIELSGSDETISHASLGRIEKGQQPYSQPILEALAEALSVEVADLLSKDPTKEGEVIDLMRLIDETGNRDMAIRLLKSMANG
jgi:transcriptional regulator with XRE-family HTH domain